MNRMISRRQFAVTFQCFRCFSNTINGNAWSDRQFGIEIEMLLPQQQQNIMDTDDLYHVINENIGGTQDDKELFIDWEIKKDITIDIDKGNGDSFGFEVVSPKLYFNQGTIHNIHEICNTVYNAPINAYYNVSCGFHVHCDASDLNTTQIYNIAFNYSFFESVIDDFMNTSRRINNNLFCQSLQFILNDDIDETKFIQSPRRLAKYLNPDGKNYKLNFNCIKWWTGLNTIENRHHMATLDINQIINWIKFNLLFIYQSNMIGPVCNNKNIMLNPMEKKELLSEFIGDNKLIQHFENRLIIDDFEELQIVQEKRNLDLSFYNQCERFINSYHHLWRFVEA